MALHVKSFNNTPIIASSPGVRFPPIGHISYSPLGRRRRESPVLIPVLPWFSFFTSCYCSSSSEWYWVKKKKIYQKCLECDFRLIWRPKKISALDSPKVGGRGVPKLGHIFFFFLVTPPLTAIAVYSDSVKSNQVADHHKKISLSPKALLLLFLFLFLHHGYSTVPCSTVCTMLTPRVNEIFSLQSPLPSIVPLLIILLLHLLLLFLLLHSSSSSSSP